MGALLLHIHRRLQDLQRSMAFRVVASAVVLIACGAFFGYLVYKSASIQHQRERLAAVLGTENVKKGDEHLVSLSTTGEVVVDGRHYGGPRFLRPRVPWFDSEGYVADLPLLVETLLRDQRPTWAPAWLIEQPRTTLLLALAATAWLLLIVWMEIALPFVLTLLGTALPVYVCWLLGKEQGMLAFGGIGLLVFTFVLLVRAAQAMLSWPLQALAVAHTVVKEASRTRIALAFITALLVLLPLLPLTLNPDDPLRFRIQTFISWSMGLTFFVCAGMTLFLSCGSVAFEIRDRQIWQLMTKPLGRLQYLLGKWLGVAAVNLVILMVSGVSIFTFIQYLRTTPVPGNEETQFMDQLAVNDEVLTARIGAKPVYEALSSDELRKRVDDAIESDPDLVDKDKVPLYKRLDKQRTIEQSYASLQRLIPAQEQRTFRFTGLKAARGASATMTLRYRFHILGDDEHQVFHAAFFYNLQEGETRRPDWQASYVPATTHAIPIPSDAIDADGNLTVTVRNLYVRTPEQQGLGAIVGGVNFEEKDFELLYKVDTFESNFLRAMLVMWIKLAVLAALGVSCAVFLSFPVACLLTFTIFVGGMLGPFLAEALQWYYPPEGGQMDWSSPMLVTVWIFETITRQIALAIVFLLSAFGSYDPQEDLVQGRLISWGSVGLAASRLGMLWSGLSLIIGFLVLRKRELAIYSGQG